MIVPVMRSIGAAEKRPRWKHSKAASCTDTGRLEPASTYSTDAIDGF
jgi:hypothetical protein